MTRRDRTELAAMLGVPESELGDYVPRFNIAPMQPYFVLKTKYESREVIPATSLAVETRMRFKRIMFFNAPSCFFGGGRTDG